MVSSALRTTHALRDQGLCWSSVERAEQATVAGSPVGQGVESGADLRATEARLPQ